MDYARLDEAVRGDRRSSPTASRTWCCRRRARTAHAPFFDSMFPPVRKSQASGVDAELSQALDEYLSSPTINESHRRRQDADPRLAATAMSVAAPEVVLAEDGRRVPPGPQARAGRRGRGLRDRRPARPRRQDLPSAAVAARAPTRSAPWSPRAAGARPADRLADRPPDGCRPASRSVSPCRGSTAIATSTSSTARAAAAWSSRRPTGASWSGSRPTWRAPSRRCMPRDTSIADVNHSSILVSQDARVRLIDCDSFQVTVERRLLSLRCRRAGLHAARAAGPVADRRRAHAEPRRVRPGGDDLPGPVHGPSSLCRPLSRRRRDADRAGDRGASLRLWRAARRLRDGAAAGDAAARDRRRRRSPSCSSAPSSPKRCLAAGRRPPNGSRRWRRWRRRWCNARSASPIGMRPGWTSARGARSRRRPACRCSRRWCPRRTAGLFDFGSFWQQIDALEHPGPAPEIPPPTTKPKLSPVARRALWRRAWQGPVALRGGGRARRAWPSQSSCRSSRRGLFLLAAAFIFLSGALGAARLARRHDLHGARARGAQAVAGDAWRTGRPRPARAASTTSAPSSRSSGPGGPRPHGQPQQRVRIEAAIRRAFDELQQIANQIQIARTSLRQNAEEVLGGAAADAVRPQDGEPEALSRSRRAHFFFGRIASHCSSVQSSIAAVLAPPPPDCSDLPPSITIASPLM